MEENNIDLRKATVEETVRLMSWADKGCKNIRKASVILFSGYLIAVIFLLIVNAIYIHSMIIAVLAIFLCVSWAVFCLASYFWIAPMTSKKIESGAFRVQSGSIKDLNEVNNKPNSKDFKVLFEAEDGTRSYISVHKEPYKSIDIGPCLIIKFDTPKDTISVS